MSLGTRRFFGAGIGTRALDNVFIERLWRSLKYELIYPGDFASGVELLAALNRYFRFYNHQRPHQASKALVRYSKNRRRNKRERTRTGKKNPGRQEIHWVPSGEIPPPATTQCKCG